MTDETTATSTTDEDSAAKRGRKTKAEEVAGVTAAELMKLPEFQTMLAAMAEKLAADLVEQRMAQGTAPQGGDNHLVRQLAMHFQQLADQDRRVKRVSPEEQEKRRAARSKMNGLILNARARRDIPRYEVQKECYLDEQLVEPTYVDRYHVRRQRQIGWPGIPNEQMKPVTETAVEIHAAFMDSIGGATTGVTRAHSEDPDPFRGLEVLEDGERHTLPGEVGVPRDTGLMVFGEGVPGEVREIAITGTLAPRARVTPR